MRTTRFIMLFVFFLASVTSYATIPQSEKTNTQSSKGITVTITELDTFGHDFSTLGPFYSGEYKYEGGGMSLPHDGYLVVPKPGTLTIHASDYENFYLVRNITLNGQIVGFGAGSYTFSINSDANIIIYYEDHYHVSK